MVLRDKFKFTKVFLGDLFCMFDNLGEFGLDDILRQETIWQVINRCNGRKDFHIDLKNMTFLGYKIGEGRKGNDKKIDYNG